MFLIKSAIFNTDILNKSKNLKIFPNNKENPLNLIILSLLLNNFHPKFLQEKEFTNLLLQEFTRKPFSHLNREFSILKKLGNFILLHLDQYRIIRTPLLLLIQSINNRNNHPNHQVTLKIQLGLLGQFLIIIMLDLYREAIEAKPD